MLHLHIGPHKTGSTTIQSFLAINADRLEALGYGYPEEGRGTSHVHHALGREFVRDGVPGARWRALAARLRREPGRHWIVSSEVFWLVPDGARDALKRALDEFDAYVVAYVRPQHELMPSLYTEQAKHGARTESFGEFFERALGGPAFDLYAGLAPWARTFGERLCVRVLEKSQLHLGDLVDDFLAAVGLDQGAAHYGLEPMPPRNRSPGPRTLDVTRRLVTLAGADPAELKALLRRVRVATDALGWNDGKAAALDADQLRRCRQRFAASNARVARELLGRTDGVLFREAPPPPGVAAPELGIDDVVRLLLKVLNR